MALIGKLSSAHSVTGTLKKSGGGGGTGGGLTLKPAEVGDIPVVDSVANGAAKTYKAVRYSWDTLPDKPFGGSLTLMSYTYGQEYLERVDIGDGNAYLKIAESIPSMESVIGARFSVTPPAAIGADPAEIIISEQNIQQMPGGTAFAVGLELSEPYMFLCVPEGEDLSAIAPGITSGTWTLDYETLGPMAGMDFTGFSMTVQTEASKIPGNMVDTHWDDIADNPFNNKGTLYLYGSGASVLQEDDYAVKVYDYPPQDIELIGKTLAYEIAGEQREVVITEDMIHSTESFGYSITHGDYYRSVSLFVSYVQVSDGRTFFTPGIWLQKTSDASSLEDCVYIRIYDFKKPAISWNENDPESAGYIGGRTHYTIPHEPEPVTLTYNGDAEGWNVWHEVGNPDHILIKLSEEIPERSAWYGNIVRVGITAEDGSVTYEEETILPGDLTELEGFGYAVGRPVMVLEYPLHIAIERVDGNAHSTEIEPGVWGQFFAWNGGKAWPSEVTYTRNTDEVKPLDDKYISKNIARAGDVQALSLWLALLLERDYGKVKTVNGAEPDENGNVTVESATVEDVLAALPTWEGGSY